MPIDLTLGLTTAVALAVYLFYILRPHPTGAILMHASFWTLVVGFFAVLAALSVPLGRHIARVMEGEEHVLARAFGGVERLLHRAAGTSPDQEQTWTAYAI